VLKDEAGQQKFTLTWDWQNTAKLRYGKYTAKMLLVYDDGTRDIPIEGSVSFWVVPWRMILFVIVVPIIPALLVYWLMRRRMRRKLRELSSKVSSTE
jgi:ABC-type glycerol-3-phosphate transport system permease component